MKSWFSKKMPKDADQGGSPYDATIERVLQMAREVNAAPAEAEAEVFDFPKALPPKTPPARVQAPAAATAPVKPPTSIANATREDMERRIANYRAFQLKLNEEREARIRRTMDDVRAMLRQSETGRPLR